MVDGFIQRVETFRFCDFNCRAEHYTSAVAFELGDKVRGLGQCSRDDNGAPSQWLVFELDLV